MQISNKTRPMFDNLQSYCLKRSHGSVQKIWKFQWINNCSRIIKICVLLSSCSEKEKNRKEKKWKNCFSWIFSILLLRRPLYAFSQLNMLIRRTKKKLPFDIVIWNIHQNENGIYNLALLELLFRALNMFLFLPEESWVLQMRIHGLGWLLCLILNLPFQSGLQRWSSVENIGIFHLIFVFLNIRIKTLHLLFAGPGNCSSKPWLSWFRSS